MVSPSLASQNTGRAKHTPANPRTGGNQKTVQKNEPEASQPVWNPHTVCRRDSCSRGKMIFPFLFLFFENLLNHTGCRLNGISFVCGHQKDYGKGKRGKKTS